MLLLIYYNRDRYSIPLVTKNEYAWPKRSTYQILEQDRPQWHDFGKIFFRQPLELVVVQKEQENLKVGIKNIYAYVYSLFIYCSGYLIK